MAFLRAVRELYSVAVRKILPPEAVRKQVIDNYRATLRDVVEARIVMETPKARILAKEVPHYWEMTGNSLYYALTEQHEANHAMFKQSDPAPNAVYTAEDVAKLQKQLAEAREELNAKDQIIKVS